MRTGTTPTNAGAINLNDPPAPPPNRPLPPLPPGAQGSGASGEPNPALATLAEKTRSKPSTPGSGANSFRNLPPPSAPPTKPLPLLPEGAGQRQFRSARALGKAAQNRADSDSDGTIKLPRHSKTGSALLDEFPHTTMQDGKLVQFKHWAQAGLASTPGSDSDSTVKGPTSTAPVRENRKVPDADADDERSFYNEFSDDEVQFLNNRSRRPSVAEDGVQ